MCMLCVEIQANKLTFKEAFKNFREMKDDIDDDHQLQIIKLINKKKNESKQTNSRQENP